MKTPRKDTDWIRVPHLHSLGDSSISGGRKIFAVVARPTRLNRDRKPVRHILIFDNHPDTLRLVSGGSLSPATDHSVPRHASTLHVLLGWLLILVLVLGMVWPLIVR
jgi:hypothetical protein